MMDAGSAWCGTQSLDPALVAVLSDAWLFIFTFDSWSYFIVFRKLFFLCS